MLRCLLPPSPPTPLSFHSLVGLEKDIAGLKREIRERDETIGDKERRIYELKKKNQELEKFKFVLDYKIKELKKQVWGCLWRCVCRVRDPRGRSRVVWRQPNVPR